MNLRPWYAKGLFAVAGALAAGWGLLIGCSSDFDGVFTGGDDFLNGGATDSFFRAIQVDPPSEDSAGPQFVVAADFNEDGFLDLASAWNQSQPLQLHLQRRNAAGSISFETVTIAGNIPVVSVAGLTVGDFDADGAEDLAVLVKETLSDGAACLNSQQPGSIERSGAIILYLGPDDPALVERALAWTEVPIEAAHLAGRGGDDSSLPEVGGFTSMAVGDVDRDNDLDILAAWNSNCAEGGASQIVLFSNGGPGAVQDGTWAATVIQNEVPIGSSVKDVALGDIDADGDLDIVATFPDAGSMNVRWFRNPQVDIPDDFHFSSTQWRVGSVAQIATQADVVRLADVDDDGLLDIVVRSSNGRLIQWLKGPGMQATTLPVPSIPWQVYTMAEFRERTPVGLAVGDVNRDGENEVVVSAGGALLWLDPDAAPSVFDPWGERLIVDDNPGNSGAEPDSGADPGAASGETLINTIRIVDLDGDGDNDVVATFDRSGLSGLSNDALVWFRNTR